MAEEEMGFSANMDLMYREPSVSSVPRDVQTVYLVISLLVAVGCGLLLIFLVWKKEYLQKPRHYLRCNLAVDDIIFVSCLIPLEICLLFSQDSSKDHLFCWVQLLIAYPTTASMFGTYLLMALELYYFICKPLHYRAKVTTKRVVIGVLFTRAFALFFGVGSELLKLHKNTGDTLRCTPEPMGSTTAAAIFLGILQAGIVIAVIVVFVLYYLVFKEARKQQQRDEHCKLWLYKTKAFNVMAPHVCVLAVSVASLLVMIICVRAFLTRNEKASDSLLMTVRVSKLLYLTVSSMVNPIVYSFRQPEFRRALRELFCRPAIQAPLNLTPPPVQRRRNVQLDIFSAPDTGQWTSDQESTSTPPPPVTEGLYGGEAAPSPAQTQIGQADTHGHHAQPPNCHRQGTKAPTSSETQATRGDLQSGQAHRSENCRQQTILTVRAEIHHLSPTIPPTCTNLQSLPSCHRTMMEHRWDIEGTAVYV
ncbi:hypothetical protein Bbelb_189990 [Branchiostoma belcheri]|nr:hypothetical protein Bbelb_189990 [Branchiostoma belcheri]